MLFYLFFLLLFCMLQEGRNLFCIPRASTVSAHVGASVAWTHIILGRCIFLFVTGWSGLWHLIQTTPLPDSRFLFWGLQCHFSWNNFDEFQLINHERLFLFLFFLYELKSNVIKATYKPEAWRKERNFSSCWAESISSHPSFISLRLFFVKLGKVLFPGRTTQEQTSNIKEKSIPQSKDQRSVLDWSPQISIAIYFFSFKFVIFLNWLEPNGWAKTFQPA